MAVSYLVKKNTVASKEEDGSIYCAGEVVSEHDLSQVIKDKIEEGIGWYTRLFEPLNDREAEKFRKKATAEEGKRRAPNGEEVDPPWDDYVGLHPKDVIDRMKTLSYEDVEKVRQYERAKLNRSMIVEYVAPAEREPWHNYEDSGVRDILEKLELLDPQAVQDVIVYEMHHKRRPAIIEFEAEPDGDVEAPRGEKIPAMTGAQE